jgi:uncharacterized membrane protein YjjP (DUF1212 family)
MTTYGWWDSKYKEFYKTKGNRVEFVSNYVKLNQDDVYVRSHLMTLNNNETNLNEISKIPSTYTFVPFEEVYKYVKFVTDLEYKVQPSDAQKIKDNIQAIKESYKSYMAGVLNGFASIIIGV